MKTRKLNWNEVIAIGPGFGKPSDTIQVSGRYAGTLTLMQMREIKRIRRGQSLHLQKVKSQN